ncbi:hypothetical protein ACLB2K_025768 [Fragaria x ananassa]
MPSSRSLPRGPVRQLTSQNPLASPTRSVNLASPRLRGVIPRVRSVSRAKSIKCVDCIIQLAWSCSARKLSNSARAVHWQAVTCKPKEFGLVGVMWTKI